MWEGDGFVGGLYRMRREGECEGEGNGGGAELGGPDGRGEQGAGR